MSSLSRYLRPNPKADPRMIRSRATSLKGLLTDLGRARPSQRRTVASMAWFTLAALDRLAERGQEISDLSRTAVNLALEGALGGPLPPAEIPVEIEWRQVELALHEEGQQLIREHNARFEEWRQQTGSYSGYDDGPLQDPPYKWVNYLAGWVLGLALSTAEGWFPSRFWPPASGTAECIFRPMMVVWWRTGYEYNEALAINQRLLLQAFNRPEHLAL